jgi:hypothetical protein
MFLGHVGVGLALKKIDRDLNAGWLVGASLLNDVALWSLVTVGLEQANIPADFAEKHFLTFDFPISHSVLGTILRSGIVFLFAMILVKGAHRIRAGIAVALGVSLHWVCDLIEHVPDLPLTTSSSPKFGLGLWQNMPVALGVEILFAVIGLWIYFRGATHISSPKKWGMVALVTAIGGLTVYGGLAASPPPGVMTLAISSLATNLLVIAFAFWLDRRTIR